MREVAEKKQKGTKPRFRSAAKEAAYLALAVALITVCAWITVPIGAVPVTLQTFAVALAGVLLGAARGLAAVCVYLLMGICGIPVFSGFRAGVPVLAGATGGYLLGFLFETALAGLFARIPARGRAAKILIAYAGMLAGLLICYFFGTLWYLAVYNGGSADPVGIASALMLCVVPFLLPDAVKLLMAACLGLRLKRYVKLSCEKR